MANYTENYSLIKPEDEDFYDVQDFNENMDLIDTQMAQTETEVAGVSEKIGTDENGKTVFSHLQEIGSAVQGFSVLKSIQRYKLEVPTTGEAVIQTITPVDLARTVVLIHRLYDPFDVVGLDYTLTENELTVTAIEGVMGSSTAKAEFWILEFY